MGIIEDRLVLAGLLRQRREALDLTREELANELALTPSYLWLIETGKVRRGSKPSRPKREKLKQWAAALGMRNEELNRVLQLAGYHPLDPSIEPQLEEMRESLQEKREQGLQEWIDSQSIVSSLPDEPIIPRESLSRRTQLRITFHEQLDDYLDKAELQSKIWDQTEAAVRQFRDLLDGWLARLQETE